MKTIDGILKDWGERTTYGKVKGRKGRNITGGRCYINPAPEKRLLARDKLKSIVKKVPEVMVKITVGRQDPITKKRGVPCKDLKSIKAHFDYISRDGNVELEDERGNVYVGDQDVTEALDNWRGAGIPYKNGTRREAFNIVLSMPPGTDRRSVKNAARDFAAEMFKNHKFVFAAHDDEKHPHVHLTVRALDNEGIRMRPLKADLQNWREVFALKLIEQGIEANATPRKLRGVVKKPEKQAVRHINKDFANEKRKAPARTTFAQHAIAIEEARGGLVHKNPFQDKIIAQRKDVLQDYAMVARALAPSNKQDKQLAVQIVDFVKQMPPLTTRHEQLVKDIRAGINKDDYSRANNLSPIQQSPKGRELDNDRTR